jgi:hypothetical protein
MKPYKEYLITYDPVHHDALVDYLQPYQTEQFTLLPLAAVRVHSAAEEQSLLEVLALIPTVTYREAVTRHVFGDTYVRRD